MRFKPSRSALVITGLVVGFILLFTVIVVALFGAGKKATTPGKPPKVAEETVKKQEEATASKGIDVGNVLQKEEQYLAEKGQNIGRVKDESSVKKLESELLSAPKGFQLMPAKEEKDSSGKAVALTPQGQGNPNMPPPLDKSLLANAPVIPGQAPAQQASYAQPTYIDNSQSALWEKFFDGGQSDKKNNGGFVKEAKEAGGKGTTGTDTHGSGNATPPDIEFYKPYAARMNFSISTDSKASSAVPFISTITQPGTSITGWKAVGKAQGDVTSNRFIVNIDGLIDPNGNKHTVKAFAASIDESNGVITAVRHDEVRGISMVALLAAAGAGMDAFREDETSVTGNAFGGTTTTRTATASNRTVEAAKAGASAGFDEAKKQVEKSPLLRLTPTLFLNKNTPIKIYFTK